VKVEKIAKSGQKGQNSQPLSTGIFVKVEKLAKDGQMVQNSQPHYENENAKIVIKIVNSERK